ncbi:hypothetical protein HMPREF1248_1118 [Coriobacteriaceae bacterium BV3Ac1]|nr:hypothetical protein HMPREF1248_1118 [Coriobacteriaceae bacterium BV3Ac1]
MAIGAMPKSRHRYISRADIAFKLQFYRPKPEVFDAGF